VFFLAVFTPPRQPFPFFNRCAPFVFFTKAGILCFPPSIRFPSPPEFLRQTFRIIRVLPARLYFFHIRLFMNCFVDHYGTKPCDFFSTDFSCFCALSKEPPPYFCLMAHLVEGKRKDDQFSRKNDPMTSQTCKHPPPVPWTLKPAVSASCLQAVVTSSRVFQVLSPSTTASLPANFLADQVNPSSGLLRG